MLAGYDNGDVKMFDLRTNSVRWEGNLGAGVVGLQVGAGCYTLLPKGGAA